MKRKTRHVTLRLTPEEYGAITEKLPPHISVSQYIRSALKEYTGTGAKRKLDMMKELLEFYRKYLAELSHAGGNLNQAMKRCNELALAGILSLRSMETLIAEIRETYNAVTGLRGKLEAITSKTMKP